MKNRRKKIIKSILVSIVLIIGTILIRNIILTRIPVKYAVYIEDVSKYSGSILVKQTWHTGTGWEIVGDETGLYEISGVRDVQLEGYVPPLVGMGGNENVYLCKVVATGTFRIEGTTSDLHEYEQFEVSDWYPIYPVKRETVLPSWLYPKEYLSRSDMK